VKVSFSLSNYNRSASRQNQYVKEIASGAWIAGGDDNVVGRGGDFTRFPAYCRSASRQVQSPERYSRHCTIGFRVVCEMTNTL
jgi:formylglycine-generating enzyme required for sulfatase activity